MNPVESIIANTNQENFTENNNDDVVGPFATSQQVLQCQFSSWYPQFSNIEGVSRSNVTIKSIVIQDLPDDLEEFILSDGVELPLDAEKISSCSTGHDDWSTDEEDGNAEVSENEDGAVQKFSFPCLTRDLQEAIRNLKGFVFPKLNWSAPKDAAWINGGSLKCSTPGDIYLLVKSSDFCLHDVLRKSWKDCEDHDPSETPPKLELVLRQWCNLHPSMEFRCFVRSHELIAISQRDHTQHYAYLLQDQKRILSKVVSFYGNTIRNRFAGGQLSNFVFDIYLDKKSRVWLLDFNIWARSTDSLLFEWSELLTMDAEDEPEFRLVETANQVRQDPLASYRAPVDTLDLASWTGGLSTNFEEFMKQCQEPSKMDAVEEDTKKLDAID